MMNRKNTEDESIPFYRQLKEKFLDDIEMGKLKHGDKLPSERELAELYGISRMTARHTLSILEREGVIERRVGAGSFIANKKIEMDFITFNSFTNVMLNRGLTPSTQILSIKRLEAKPVLATKLKLMAGDEIFSIKRLRLVNQMPISIEESCLPEKFAPDIDKKITNDSSLYQLLESDYGITLVKAKTHMQVTISTDSDSKLLKIRSESPCIFQESVAFDRNGREIEFSTQLTRSDIVKFYSESNLR